MMKSQRSASKKLQLASLFRWLAILCFVKLSIFTMILLDVPFPALLDKSADRLPGLEKILPAEKSAAPAQADKSPQDLPVATAQPPALSEPQRTQEKAPVPLAGTATEKRGDSEKEHLRPTALLANTPPEPAEPERPVFQAPDLPLPDPLPAPIAEPGTIAPLERQAQNEMPVPTLGSVTAAKAAASLPVPTAGPSSSPFTPVEQKVEPERREPAKKKTEQAAISPKTERPSMPTPTSAQVQGGAQGRNALQMNTEVQELARQQQDMLMLKKQMDDRLKELKDSEVKVKKMLEEARGVEEQKLKALIQMYANMKPKTAAKALESMEERTACQILSGMTPKQSGDILSYTNPAVTAKLTELLTRMRIQ